MSFSVIRFEGSIQNVLEEGLTLLDAAQRARNATWTGRDSTSVVAVVNEEDDQVVWDHIYHNGRNIDRATVNSIVYGLGRFM